MCVLRNFFTADCSSPTRLFKTAIRCDFSAQRSAVCSGDAVNVLFYCGISRADCGLQKEEGGFILSLQRSCRLQSVYAQLTAITVLRKATVFCRRCCSLPLLCQLHMRFGCALNVIRKDRHERLIRHPKQRTVFKLKAHGAGRLSLRYILLYSQFCTKEKPQKSLIYCKNIW